MSNTESGLMKQTKKELVAIILCKDDTEKKLNKELADVKLDFDKAKSIISRNESTINTLREELCESEKNVNQHQNVIDELTIINADIEHSLRNSKRWNIALAILFVCAVAAAIVF